MTGETVAIAAGAVAVVARVATLDAEMADLEDLLAALKAEDSVALQAGAVSPSEAADLVALRAVFGAADSAAVALVAEVSEGLLADLAAEGAIAAAGSVP